MLVIEYVFPSQKSISYCFFFFMTNIQQFCGKYQITEQYNYTTQWLVKEQCYSSICEPHNLLVVFVFGLACITTLPQPLLVKPCLLLSKLP